MAPSGLVRALTAAASALEASADELNRLDGYAGDGDLGITMSEASRALKDVLAANQDMEAGPLLSACGAAIARKAPSTSGTLVATGFLRAAKAVADPAGHRGTPAPTSRPWSEHLRRRQRVSRPGARRRPGTGRSLTAWTPCAPACRSPSAPGTGWADALHFAAAAASAAADRTVGMEPKVGRASWVPQRAIGHPDAGCAMLAIAMQAAAAEITAGGAAPAGG